MPGLSLFHHHHRHRSRQLRWVLPIVAVVLAGAIASAIVTYEIGDRTVSSEFFRAHETIHETGELLRTGLLVGLGLSAALVAFVAVWSFRVTHRIVRPVHALHQALDALGAGRLGTRVELHRHDEFQETADALNLLAGGLAAAIARLEQLAASSMRRASTRRSPDAARSSRASPAPFARRSPPSISRRIRRSGPMDRRMRHELVLAIVLLWRARAGASPTGLVQIPTAQTLAPRQVDLSLQNGNTSVTDAPTLVHDPQLLYQSEAGILTGVEGGVDVVPSDPPGAYLPEANLKWRFLDEGE